jgi:hypothetical protein
MVHFQRMLRYPPNERLGTLLDLKLDPVQDDASAAEVARILATTTWCRFRSSTRTIDWSGW